MNKNVLAIRTVHGWEEDKLLVRDTRGQMAAFPGVTRQKAAVRGKVLEKTRGGVV